MNSNKNQKTVVILGMHRSGTSVAAGILQILGVDMGDTLLKNNKSNVKGHFEDIEFLSLNKRILNSYNASWRNPLSIADDCNGVFLSDLQRITNKSKKLWGWKDPRTVLTIELYLPHLVNPYFIVCSRNPFHVALSLSKRNNFDILRGLKLTNKYNEQIVRFFEKHPDLPKMYLAFEDTVNNPIAESGKIADFLNLKLTKKSIKQIKKFVLSKSKIKREIRRMRQRAKIEVIKNLIIRKFKILLNITEQN